MFHPFSIFVSFMNFLFHSFHPQGVGAFGKVSCLTSAWMTWTGASVSQHPHSSLIFTIIHFLYTFNSSLSFFFSPSDQTCNVCLACCSLIICQLVWKLNWIQEIWALCQLSNRYCFYFTENVDWRMAAVLLISLMHEFVPRGNLLLKNSGCRICGFEILHSKPSYDCDCLTDCVRCCSCRKPSRWAERSTEVCPAGSRWMWRKPKDFFKCLKQRADLKTARRDTSGHNRGFSWVYHLMVSWGWTRRVMVWKRWVGVEPASCATDCVLWYDWDWPLTVLYHRPASGQQMKISRRL